MKLGRPRKHPEGTNVHRANIRIPDTTFMEICRFAGYKQSQTGIRSSLADLLVEALHNSPEFKRWRASLDKK